MKHIALYTAAAAAAILSAASCKMADVDKILPDGGNSFTLKIRYSAPETKTGLIGLVPYWKAGDELWISDGTKSVKATVPVEAEGNINADVTVTGLDSTKVIYAVYPYDESTQVTDGAVSIDIKAGQDGSFAGGHRLVGKRDAGQEYMYMHNASAIIKFTTAKDNLAAMQLSNPDGGISGRFLMDPSTGLKSADVTAGNAIQLDIDGQAGEYYVSLMGTTLPAGTRISFLTKDGCLGAIVTSAANELKNGYLYDLGTIDDMLVIDANPASDLSASESANCYITRKAGSYRFKTVKGNGNESVGDAVSASTVWETVNTVNAPSAHTIIADVVYYNGNIYFSIPQNPVDGNALLAARDKDGNILWSWHIWNLKNGLQDQSYGTSYSNATMMDRNLGALSATAGDALAMGFLYQYGRKDPVIGSAKAEAGAEMKVCGTGFKAVSRDAVTGTMEYAVANPTTMICSTTDSWLNEYTTAGWSSANKTIDDPCPAGYTIASGMAYEGFTRSNLKWDATNLGRSRTISNKVVWFPASGCRTAADGTLAEAGETVYNYVDQSTHLIGSNSMSGTSKYYYVYPVPFSHANAFPVRCQRITKKQGQSLRMLYKVEDPANYVNAPYAKSMNFTPFTISWGEGEPEKYLATKYHSHQYENTGSYTVTVDCADIADFDLDPVGDLETIDLSTF